ncbi:helix-turn-helix domain-containing protein [Streptococcus mitis]|uniref:helix-turn-helix domain-containing protein n=1 Tax=Streptococcus mitis TaxID=28037 RepID=UPI003B21D522
MVYLNIKERIKIELDVKSGVNVFEIATMIGFSHLIISREMKRFLEYYSVV